MHLCIKCPTSYVNGSFVPLYFLFPSVQCLNALDVVLVKFEAISEGSVEGRHDGTPHVGVGQPQRVAQLVRGRHQQVGPGLEVVRPPLVVIEVDISAVDGEEGVGEGAAPPVEVVLVAVSPLLEPDLDVNFARGFPRELEVGGVCPDAERGGDDPVGGAAAEPAGVLGHAVGQRARLPPRPVQREPLPPPPHGARLGGVRVRVAAPRQPDDLLGLLVQVTRGQQTREVLQLTDRRRKI